MLNMPIIRLELEYVKENICHMIADHHEELSTAVQEEICKAINRIDIEAMVRSGVQDCVSSAIQEYFRLGAGRRVITESVFRSLDNVMEGLSGKE